MARGFALGLFAVLLLRVQAQSPNAGPRFEVASVKACPDQPDAARGARKADPLRLSPDRLHLGCQTLSSLIHWAYINFEDGRFNPLAHLPISGGPAWIDSELFEIDAKASGPQPWGALNGPMLRALLEERFKLKIRRQATEVPVYALTVGKGGPKLQRSRRDCIAFDPEHSVTVQAGTPFPALCGMSRITSNGYDAPAVTMEVFAKLLSSNADRKVIDRTGLTGLYDIHLNLTAEDLGHGSPAEPADIFDAMRGALRKIGLNAEPAKGPGETLVIERAEKTADNDVQ